MKDRIIVILCLLVGLNAYAQKVKKPKKEKPLPENIEVFPKNFLVRPRFVYPQVWFDVSSRLRGRGEKFTYKPSSIGVIGLSLKIKKVYISAAVQLPVQESIKRKYGDTKFRNININIQGRILGWGLFFRNYKGFYLDNYQSYYPNRNEDSLGYPTSPGLKITEAGLNLSFNFNKNFSMNAAFAQGERQKKSAGSFLIGLSERYQRIDADTSFVPPTQGKYYPNLDKLVYGNFVTTIVSVGFGYQFVRSKFHFTPVVMLGSGFQFQSYTQTNKRHFRINAPTYTNLKGQIGYNGNHFFANFIASTEFNSIPIKESRIRLLSNWLEFGIGVRF